MAVLLLAAASIATVAFLFLAPAQTDHPRLLIVWLLLTLLIWLAGLTLACARRSPNATDILPGPQPRRPGFAVIGGGFALLFAAFVFAPVFLSDDSIRHIHDGFYLLQGVDVYTTPPERLPRLLDRLPNHPDVGTIYLPFTQLQALSGAGLHAHYGFLIVYYAVAWLAMALTWRWSRGSGERAVLLGFWTSPIFLIAAASRHADVQGCLLALLALLALRRARVFVLLARAGRRPALARGACVAFACSLALSLAAGLKPEGALYAVGLGLVALSWLWRGPWPFAAAFGAGAIVGAGGLGYFAYAVLFASDQAWPSFLNTVRLFTDWFAAYNPLLELREWLQPESERPQLMARYRRELAAVALFVFAAPLLWSVLRGRQLLRRGLWLRALLIAVAASVLSKGVWHPWYFLWLLPALWIAGWRRTTIGLAGALVLFYLPVIYLRAGGEWSMQIFYAAMLVYLPGFTICARLLLPGTGSWPQFWKRSG